MINQNNVEIEGDVNHKIQVGWAKWRSLSRVFFDLIIFLKLKGKFYGIVNYKTFIFLPYGMLLNMMNMSSKKVWWT